MYVEGLVPLNCGEKRAATRAGAAGRMRIMKKKIPLKPRKKTALDAVQPFRWRIGLTYALTFVEDLLELSYPWATGLAIDGLIAHEFHQALPIVIAWMARASIGCFRQMYDTRVYTSVYNNIVEDTIVRQRKAGIEATSVAARSAMSREFVTFFETDVPVVITSLIHILGSAIILFWYDYVIGGLAALLFIPVYLVNRVYIRVTARLNRELNDQLEKEVVYIERHDREEVRSHFTLVRKWRVKLSDAAAYNWTIIEVLSILVFIAILLRATVLPESETGDIFAILVYVWRLMEGLDHVPTIVQQLTRLRDISVRISQGASVEAVSEAIEESEPDEKPI
jgi:ABC-type multidrug transport system fused ATPase/permease subunit